MNPFQANEVLFKVLAYCPAQSMNEHTPDAWAEALDDIRHADALEAVRRLGRRPIEPGQSRFIDPGHVRAEVARIRKERIDNHPQPEPPSGLASADFLSWQRAVNERIADGEIIARPAIEARPMPDLRGLLRSVDDAADDEPEGAADAV